MLMADPAAIPDPRETSSEEFRRLLLSSGADPAVLARLFHSGEDKASPDALRRKLDRRIANDSQATRHVLAMELLLRATERPQAFGPVERTAQLSERFYTMPTWPWANSSLPEFARYLIASAELGGIAPYGTMHDRLAAMGLIKHAGFDTALGRPLGLLGWSLCGSVMPEIMDGSDRVPLLSVLACRKPIGNRPFVPGDGFDEVAATYCKDWLTHPSAHTDKAKLERWLSVFGLKLRNINLYGRDRVRAVEEMQEDCFGYQYWADVLKYFGLQPLDIQ